MGLAPSAAKGSHRARSVHAIWADSEEAHDGEPSSMRGLDTRGGASCCTLRACLGAAVPACLGAAASIHCGHASRRSCLPESRLSDILSSYIYHTLVARD